MCGRRIGPFECNRHVEDGGERMSARIGAVDSPAENGVQLTVEPEGSEEPAVAPWAWYRRYR
ncbi:hypothetical protein C8E97_2831 [Saccharothrix australiensis]|uniref:Uncharacterized protein n=1 Tax=Saccharothrix australiensis TaxID=2072 RepID=A0A495VY16_9PSEU|nr:hypothetical protein C8E97_2831 [Saccharothrix australiensis]